jgi:hypothetical protein
MRIAAALESPAAGLRGNSWPEGAPAGVGRHLQPTIRHWDNSLALCLPADCLPQLQASMPLTRSVIKACRTWSQHSPASLKRIKQSLALSDQERHLQELERQFPLASGQAFAAARAQVLASGQSVLQSEGGFVVRVFPNGRQQRIKPLELPTPVTPGTTFIIR